MTFIQGLLKTGHKISELFKLIMEKRLSKLLSLSLKVSDLVFSSEGRDTVGTYRII